jgi:translation elongation factor EF-Tu-like GTPase
MGSRLESVATFIVADTFAIEGRGLVLVPGFPFDAGVIHVGDQVRLRRPDGTAIDAKIAGLEMINMGAAHPVAAAPISLRGVSKSDVPIGTAVSLLPVNG